MVMPEGTVSYWTVCSIHQMQGFSKVLKTDDFGKKCVSHGPDIFINFHHALLMIHK